MTEGDKILAAALALAFSILGVSIKQSVWLKRIVDMLGETIAMQMLKHSKWECKFKPPEKPSDGTQKPSGADQLPR